MKEKRFAFVVAVTVRGKSRGSPTLNLDECRECESNFRDYVEGIMREETLTKRDNEKMNETTD